MREIVLDFPAAVACPTQAFNFIAVITATSARGWWWSGAGDSSRSQAIDAARRTGWNVLYAPRATLPNVPVIQMIAAAQASLKEEQDV